MSVAASAVRGFTLVEILVVLIIISVIATVTLMAVDVTGYQKSRAFVKDFRFLMRNLADEATLTGYPHAIQLDTAARAVKPVVFESGSWRPMADINALKWSDSMKVKMTVDGVDIDEFRENDDDEPEDDFLRGGFAKEKKNPPEVTFWPIGLWHPAGTIELIIDSLPYVKFTWTPSGKMTTEYPQHEEEF